MWYTVVGGRGRDTASQDATCHWGGGGGVLPFRSEVTQTQTQTQAQDPGPRPSISQELNIALIG